MSIKDIFFGEKNIQLLAKILGEELNIDDTKVARAACKNFVVTQMKLVFKKNEDKIMNADPKKILPKLNDKAVTEALKVYSKSANPSGGKSERSERPERSERSEKSGRRQQKPSGPQAMYSGGGDSGYAPIVSGDGDYITATGEIGKKMFFGNIEQQMSMGNKQSSKEEIDRLVLMRRAEYEGGGDDEFAGMDGGMGMNGMGMNGMMNPAAMGYGYNPMGSKKQRPNEINFCVDGGDTRGIANGDVNNGEGGFNPMTAGFGGMMGPGMMGGGTRGGNPGGMYPGMGGNMMGGGMNPGMNMAGMQPNMMGGGLMGQNPMLGGGSGGKRGSNADVEARLAQMEAERNGGGFDTGYTPMMNHNMMGGQQNGMMPPNMMGGMHPMMNNNGYNSNSGFHNQNFQMGGRGGNSELEELVKDKKRELAQKIGLDPEALMNLSREQIESLMHQSDSESEQDSSDDASDDSDDRNLSVKEMLIRKLKNKRLNNEKNHKKLNTEVKSVLSKMDKKLEKSKTKSKKHQSSDDESDRHTDDSDSDDEKDKKRSKQTKKSRSEKERSNSSKNKSRSKTKKNKHSDDSDSDQSRDEEPEEEVQVQKKPEKRDSYENVSKQDMKVKKRDESSSKLSVTKSIDSSSLAKQSLNVKSDAWTEPQFYNNYQVSLKTPLQNLKKILVKGESDFPLLRPAIDEKHNTFCIIYKKETIPIELDPDDGYVLSEIIDGVNDAFKSGDIPILMKVDKKGLIVVENTKGEKFDISLKDNSMGPYLGFQEQEYKNKIRYVSECPHMFIDQSYYMFIKEISPDDPVCEITPDGKVIQLIDDLTGTSDLRIKSAVGKVIKTLTFQYRYNRNNSSELIDFYEEPHEISFDLLYQDESKTKNNSQNSSGSKSTTKTR